MARRFKDCDRWESARLLLHDLKVLQEKNPGHNAEVQLVMAKLLSYEKGLRQNEYARGPITSQRYEKHFKRVSA